MTVVQAMTGSGGWPMTVIMTPDKEPFYAGTYFPKNARWGRPGLMQMLPRIAAVWQNDRQKVLTSTVEIVQYLNHCRSWPKSLALQKTRCAKVWRTAAKNYIRSGKNGIRLQG